MFLHAVLWNSGSRSSCVPQGQELGETSPIQVPALHLGHPESQSLLDFCVQGTWLPSSGFGSVTHQLCDPEQVMYPL